MGNRPKSYSKTTDLVLRGSDSGPGGGARVRSYGGAPTLYSTNRGEKTLESNQPGTGRVYPPVYGESPNIGQNQKSSLRKKSAPGYTPTAGQLTASPNPF